MPGAGKAPGAAAAATVGRANTAPLPPGRPRPSPGAPARTGSAAPRATTASLARSRKPIGAAAAAAALAAPGAAQAAGNTATQAVAAAVTAGDLASRTLYAVAALGALGGYVIGDVAAGGPATRLAQALTGQAPLVQVAQVQGTPASQPLVPSVDAGAADGQALKPTAIPVPPDEAQLALLARTGDLGAVFVPILRDGRVEGYVAAEGTLMYHGSMRPAEPSPVLRDATLMTLYRAAAEGRLSGPVADGARLQGEMLGRIQASMGEGVVDSLTLTRLLRQDASGR